MKVFFTLLFVWLLGSRPCGDSLPMWYGTVRAGIHPAPCLVAEEISV